MLKGGSELGNVEIRYYSRNFRGVHASNNIKKGDTILFVPNKLILSYYIVKDYPICKHFDEKMWGRDFAKKLCFVSYLLDQSCKPETDRKFKELIDLFP